MKEERRGEEKRRGGGVNGDGLIQERVEFLLNATRNESMMINSSFISLS